MLLMMTIGGCLSVSSSKFSFIRENNLGYATSTQGTILCNKRAIQDWIARAEPEYADIYTVFWLTNSKRWHAIILAFDVNKDGFYETMYFDTDGDGDLNLFLQGNIDTDEIKRLFCSRKGRS